MAVTVVKFDTCIYGKLEMNSNYFLINDKLLKLNLRFNITMLYFNKL